MVVKFKLGSKTIKHGELYDTYDAAIDAVRSYCVNEMGFTSGIDDLFKQTNYAQDEDGNPKFILYQCLDYNRKKCPFRVRLARIRKLKQPPNKQVGKYKVVSIMSKHCEHCRFWKRPCVDTNNTYIDYSTNINNYTPPNIPYTYT